MKVAIIPNGDIKDYQNYDYLIIGLYGLSINTYSLNYDELVNIINNNKVFVAINKNIHNDEINMLEDYLIKLSKLPIEGILYTDVAVLEINNELNLNLNLIWSAEHLATNYHTINYWNNSGANGTFISNDITKREILEIRKNTKCPLMVQVFGYVPIYASRRHAILNYKTCFNINDSSNVNYLNKEGKDYPIVDYKTGTEVYSNNILCALDETLEYDKAGIQYMVINFFNINKYQNEIINIFKTVTEDLKEEYNSFISNKFTNVDKCFLYLETIYKVK